MQANEKSDNKKVGFLQKEENPLSINLFSLLFS